MKKGAATSRGFPIKRRAEVKASSLPEMMLRHVSLVLFDSYESDPPVDPDIWTLIRGFLTEVSTVWDRLLRRDCLCCLNDK